MIAFVMENNMTLMSTSFDHKISYKRNMHFPIQADQKSSCSFVTRGKKVAIGHGRTELQGSGNKQCS